LNSGIHLGYAWLLGDAAGFDLSGRRAVAIAGVAADLDGIAIVLGRDAFDKYHHVVFHNLIFVAAITLSVFILFPKRPRLVLFCALAGLLHLGLDFVGSHWDLPLLRPFSSGSVNLTDYVPAWFVIYLLQGIGTVLMFVLMFRIFLKKGRSFFEVFTSKGDRLIMNFLTLPWRHRCRECGKRAFYRCGDCGACLCSHHRKAARGWRLLCERCLAKDGGLRQPAKERLTDEETS